MNRAVSGWKNCILAETLTLKEAISVLNEVGTQILLVVDSQNKLLGTVTDGDIRRVLLGGADLAITLKSMVNRNPITLAPSATEDEIFHAMKVNNILQIPITDDYGKILDLYLWKDFQKIEQFGNYILIMAGGKGERLHPETFEQPKPLLEVAGKPILQHIIENSVRSGFTNFIISINYLGDKIKDFFGSGEKLGVQIQYVEEITPLGTAGALGKIKDLVADAFVVINGDLITNINLADMLKFHKANLASATMAVKPHEIQNPFGVVTTSGDQIISYDEKPNYRSLVNAGIYVFNSNVSTFIPQDRYVDMPEVFQTIIDMGMKVVAFPVHESWSDIGRPEDLARARTSQKELKNDRK